MPGRTSFELAPTANVHCELAANSLFRNILRVTASEPIFCEHKTVSPARKSPVFNILRAAIQKPRTRPATFAAPCSMIPALPQLSFQLAPAANSGPSESPTKSLVCNILPVSHAFPIFCSRNRVSPACNPFVSNILGPRSKNDNSPQTRPAARAMALKSSARPCSGRVFSGCKLIQSLIPHLFVSKGSLPWQRSKPPSGRAQACIPDHL